MAEKTNTSLARKAMLVSLETGSWSARTVDADVTDEVGAAHAAQDDHGKYHKRLLSKEATKRVNALRQAARTYHNGITLPWQDHHRLLPVNLYESYRDTLADFEEQRIVAREELIAMFSGWMAEAKERLGSMFDEADYPDPSELREAYYMTVEFTPVPDVKNFVADLAEDEKADVAKQIEQQIETRIAAANRDLHRRLYDLTQNVRESLGNGRFSSKLYERLTETLEVLPRLNISNDTELEGLVAKLQKAAEQVKPEQLREANRSFDEHARDTFVDQVDDVATRMSGYFGDPPAPPAPAPEEDADE